jgi:hypothetical protein
LTLYRNGRRAYSSRNFRTTDGKWEWQTLQDRWRSEKRVLILTDQPTTHHLLRALSGNPIVAILGGLDAS